MKHFFRNLMLFGVATAMFAACGDEPEVTKRDSDSKANTSLELSKTELTFAKIAESKSVAITTSESWLAETPADWVTISPLAGNGTSSITISVTENMLNTARESYVKISTKSDEKMVVVVQSGDTNNGGENGGENGNENGGDNQQGNVTIEDGAIKAAFSVSDNKKVYFSQGNLQYQASTNTWRFAEHQHDICGEDNRYIYVATSTGKWIDMFGWGTSGWNSGANAYQPCSASTEARDYYPGGSYSNDLTGSYANADWGVYNRISNGGNQAGLWRTLTSSEWNYLISGRAQANLLMGQGSVNNVNGLILLPDGWETPSSVKFTYAGDYSTNTYSLDEWEVMQSYGAVFLPDAGCRTNDQMSDDGAGRYWSTSATGGKDLAFILKFNGYLGSKAEMKECWRYHGVSVRLVKDVQ